MINNFLSPEIKANIWPVVMDYRRKRDSVLDFSEREKLREEIYQMKKSVFDHLAEIQVKTIDNLTKNRIKVLLAKDDEEARQIVAGLVGEARVILKSKSNIADEIDVKKALPGKDVVETDLGDFINQILGEEDLHPVMPAFHLAPEKIVAKFYQKFGRKIEPTPQAIAEFAREQIRKKIVEAEVGLTGANAITADGQIIILENEGNASLVSRWPKRHIILSGIEKLVPDLAAAMKIVKASAVWGTGGACLNFCPAFHNLGRAYGDKYLGSKGIIFAALSRGLLEAKKSNAYACTLCSACFANCPAKINLPELMKKIRQKLNGAALSTEANKKMIANLEKFGNPFGDLGGEPPKSLFCC
ncbi:MAG: LUD domain-containing protein [Candidatus Parcubacteria bacterium]|nr:LUD domain-containing protein [Candidatus Parcubacteria bacterium]